MNQMLLNTWLTIQSVLASEEGQDVVEYALVFSVIALGAAAGMNSVASGIGTEFGNISTFLGNHIG
jgi:Flp pilus assembly pilin Flp